MSRRMYVSLDRDRGTVFVFTKVSLSPFFSEVFSRAVRRYWRSPKRRSRCDERIETFSTFSSQWRYVKRPRTLRSTATRRWPTVWVAWVVAAADDDAAWAPVFSVAAVDALRKTYHLLPRCWATAKAPGPLAPAAAAGTPGSTRSRTTIATTGKGRAAAGQTANAKIIIVINY